MEVQRKRRSSPGMVSEWNGMFPKLKQVRVLSQRLGLGTNAWQHRGGVAVSGVMDSAQDWDSEVALFRGSTSSMVVASAA